jgi:tetratricopeptide (TPR) repeat protein
VAILLFIAASVSADLTAPPDGNNQRASVTQYMGLVRVTIDYNSPRVHHPTTNEDRRGKIWGKLVPYGLVNLGFGTCTECPWRAGANENTVFTTSHDIKVEGQALPAGSYGLHLIPAENADWTLIFSKDYTNWGSFFYDAAHDALRVKVKPSKSDYHEYLTYEFPDRQLDKATAMMKWEDVQVPFNLSVDNLPQLYLAEMRRELRGQKGFEWQNWLAASRYALDQKIEPETALRMAKVASQRGFPGQENFATLSLLADAQAANNMTAESAATRQKALESSSATPLDLHMYGRQLQQQGKKTEALAVFELNAKKHPNEWPVNVGLARGYSAVGRYKDALKYAKLALAQAPDENNKRNLQAGIEKLEAGKDMNQ